MMVGVVVFTGGELGVLFGFRLRRPDLDCDRSCDGRTCKSLPGCGLIAGNDVGL